ncbi:hypothetical protein MF451_003698 [Salmonella enterica subsp. enterica serovar Saintpaul]|nr:hypothetical protein [Salmonella enterica subsp. enterica serovar Saintpaul]
MFYNSPPTDQRAGVKPIAFTLQDTDGGLSSPVTLKIRPEDLTRTEPQRVSTTQTLGRGTIGWIDHFGEGLPSLSINGHTGWRTAQGSGQDGAQAFETLNNLISHRYPAAIQTAINSGRDPADVKLIFVDMLDNFSWVVVPQTFILRRSKSRPLLFQYTMQLQCIATDLENPLKIVPFAGSIFSGLKALGGVISTIEDYGTKIEGWIHQAVDIGHSIISPIASTVKDFMVASNRIFQTVNNVITTGKNAINSTANELIGIAGDFAKVGMNIHRTIANLAGVPNEVRHALMRVSSAYSEAFCIFNNSLRQRKIYQSYDGLNGASNCSSTTGGSQPSAYVNMNAFALLNDHQSPVTMSADARSAISELANADPVLKPKTQADMPEMARKVQTATKETKING